MFTHSTMYARWQGILKSRVIDTKGDDKVIRLQPGGTLLTERPPARA